MTEQDFIRLLERFERGRCTAEEQRQLEQWLDNIKEGQGPFKSKIESDLIEMDLRQSIYRKAGVLNGEVSMDPMQEIKSRGLRTKTLMYRIAASILILISFGYGLWMYDVLNQREPIITEIISGTGVQKLLLADGSIVWLKPNSKLVYPEEFQGEERLVTLEGEGLFEVAKDPQHPFIIHSGGLTTKVLGTSFNIKNSPEGTEVYVLTGKVSVTSAHNKQHVELLPTEKILYANATLQKVKGESAVEGKPVYTKGTEYDMYFQDTRINEIAKRIKSKFNVEVVIEGDIENCVITADFTDQSLNDTMDMISEALNAQYSIDKDKVVLAGGGCK